MEKPMSNLEEVLQALYDSEINASISWLLDYASNYSGGSE